MSRLTTSRLVLEPVLPANAVTLWRIMQSADLREFQDVPRHTREEFERRVAARPKRFDARTLGRYEWLLILTPSHEPIGWVSLRVGERLSGAAELGYSVLGEHRGLGYATEAVQVLTAYAFEAGGIRRLEACCVPENLASRRLLTRLSFNQRRIQRSGAMLRGRPVDVVLFELTRTEWHERSERAPQDDRTPTAAMSSA